MRLWTTMLMLVLLMVGHCAAQTATASEYEIKAAYLYNFAKFTDWPETSPTSGMFDIAFLGDSEIESVLKSTLSGKQVGNQTLRVYRVDGLDALLKSKKTPRILFVSSSSPDSAETVHAALGKLPVLTVGENDSFIDGGGIITFVLQDNRLRFQINLGEARRCGLTISSKLLSLAAAVKEGDKP